MSRTFSKGLIFESGVVVWGLKDLVLGAVSGPGMGHAMIVCQGWLTALILVHWGESPIWPIWESLYRVLI
jgi:hypothetical protein